MSDSVWQHFTDGDGNYYRICFGDGRFLLGQVYSTKFGWERLEMIDGLPFELCGAYWAPSQGGACDLPKGHDEGVEKGQPGWYHHT